MSKIMFYADNSKSYEAFVNKFGQNQIRLIFKKQKPQDEILYSGFGVINEYNGIVEADYFDYKYKYRDVDDIYTAELDNNNLPYVEPIVMTTYEDTEDTDLSKESNNISLEVPIEEDKEEINNEVEDEAVTEDKEDE